MELSFTDDALDDVHLIVRYGLDRVTGMNVDRYIAALDEALDSLEIYPLIGRNADDVSSGLRVLPVDSHRLLSERDWDQAELRAALAVGLDQIERGETVPWTPDLLPPQLREAKEMVAAERRTSEPDER